MPTAPCQEAQRLTFTPHIVGNMQTINEILMSNAPSSAVKSILARLLLLFLVVTFAVWGVGDIVRGGPSQVAAKVGDTTISTAEFQREWQFYIENSGTQAPTDPATRNALQRQVLERMVRQHLLKMAALDSGMAASEKLVADKLRRDPAFQDMKGKFDVATYKRVLEANRLTEKQFTQLIGDQSLIAFMQDSVRTFQAAPEALHLLALSSAQETRSVDVVEFSPARASDVALPKASVLKEVYDQEKELRYMNPESRDFLLATIAESEISALAEKLVQPSDIEEYKTNHADELAKLPAAKVEAHVRDALVTSKREEAVHELSIALEDALASGESLEKALAIAGVKASMDTLKAVTQESLDSSHKEKAAFLDGGFTMEEEETSALQITEKGIYYVLQLQRITPAAPKPFEEVKDDVFKRYVEATQASELDALAEKVKADLQKAQGVNAVNASLKQHGLKPLTLILSRGQDKYTEISPLLRIRIFEAQRGDVIGPAVNPQTGGLQLAIVQQVMVPAVSALKENPVTQSAIDELFAQSVQQSAMASAQDKHPVRITLPSTSADGS